MQSSQLIKLAPTLAAGERYKLLVTDMQRVLGGEKALISESEREAMTHFQNRPAWEEYTRNICIMQWATTLWAKDIEAERLRVYAIWLTVSFTFERVLLDGDNNSISKKKRAEQFENLKKYVAMLERQSVEFYAYPEAIKKVEQELYGTPLFNKKKKAEISAIYETVDEFIDTHNEAIQMLCKNAVIKKRIRPIAADMDSYLIKKPVPQADLIEQIVNEIRQIGDSEMQMLGR